MVKIPESFCPQCGSSSMQTQIPDGDNRQRAVCAECNFILYQNPKVVAGCLLYHEDRILLAKRAIAPRIGRWTLPAGFMELGETTAQAAARECFEEALATPRETELYSLISIPPVGQVYVIYRGELEAGRFGVGEESSDAALFPAEELPWDNLAFPFVEMVLERFLHDRERNQFPVFERVITRRLERRNDEHHD